MKKVPSGMHGKPSSHAKVPSGAKFISGKAKGLKRTQATKQPSSKAHLYDSMSPKGY